nr:MAG TPA: hypothetical protein [Bacteriophage sp.]DAH34362.1 MAG TPA: hypothetical protein [Caudoviricetes sp.]
MTVLTQYCHLIKPLWHKALRCFGDSSDSSFMY